MGQEKRVLLAFVISFAVLMLWARWRASKMPPPAPETSAPVPVRLPERPQAAPAPPPPSPVELAGTKGAKSKEIVVENDFYKVTLDTRGAVVKSWVLKEFQDEKNLPLDLVNRAACEQMGFPMSFALADSGLAGRLNQAVYVAKTEATSLTAPTQVELLFGDGQVQARKQFRFGQEYDVRVQAGVFDGRQYVPIGVAWPGGFGEPSENASASALAERALIQRADSGSVERETVTASTISRIWAWLRGAPPEEPPGDFAGPFLLAGVEDRYFTEVMFPASPRANYALSRRPWTPPDWKGKDEDKPRPLVGVLASPEPAPLDFRIFVGPKKIEVLRAQNPPLDHLVDFGWFWPIAKPLFLAMRYIYDHWIHNYGWGIVILTLVINLAMFPLKLKSIRSGQEMQKVAPLVKAIQEKGKNYKFNDPRKQRINQEVMKIYQDHGINPLGGCLPMALQMPFLYGFYNVLNSSIELRHAPWILWIKDLSAPDPTYVLPIVMTVTMFILQRMTPMPATDPAQQRMMTSMPLIFGFMFIRFASGLVLYWLTSNVVGIGQQVFINRRLPPAQSNAGGRKPPPAKD